MFCTTTRIYPSDQMPVVTDPSAEALGKALAEHRVVCAGSPGRKRENSPLPGLPLETIRAMADFVLVEADGSARLPLKAHLAHEPVVPPCTVRRLLVVGASGFGRPIGEAAPPARSSLRCWPPPASGDPATPERIAAVLRREGGFDAVIVNQVTSPRRMQQAPCPGRAAGGAGVCRRGAEGTPDPSGRRLVNRRRSARRRIKSGEQFHIESNNGWISAFAEIHPGFFIACLEELVYDGPFPWVEMIL